MYQIGVEVENDNVVKNGIVRVLHERTVHNKSSNLQIVFETICQEYHLKIAALLLKLYMGCTLSYAQPWTVTSE